MNKKQTIKKTAALLLGLAIAMGTTGCGFITTNHQKDLDQIVAKVSIANEMEGGEEFKQFTFSGEIKKRELISYYMSVGYQYVQNYGLSKEDAYNMLLNSLVNREILAQNAANYFLEKSTSLKYGNDSEGYVKYKNEQIQAEEDLAKKALLKDHEDVLKLKYILTNGGTDNTEYDIAVYSLMKSINDTIDSMEKSYITEENDDHDHEETRTLPTGVNTEAEDHYEKTTPENGEKVYAVYTGRNAADSIEGYDKLDGSTRNTRKKAYNAFLTNLENYNLVSTSGAVENTSDVTYLEYYYVELASLLEQRLINNYYDAEDDVVAEELSEEFVNNRYTEMFDQNKRDYEGSPTSFASAMDSASADSFLLYAPTNTHNGEAMTFGYVYNILLPFSQSQSVEYTQAKNKNLSESALFTARRKIGYKISAKDLRTSWFVNEDHTDYSYKDGEEYKFFENHDGNKYEELSHYLGVYPFNGTVTKNEEGEYDVKASKVADIDAFMEIFNNTITTALQGTNSSVSGSADKANYDTTNYYTMDGDDEVINYEKFIYYNGKVNFGTGDEPTAADFFNKNSAQYKALSAVNELMFAYSTDTGCLNTYMGYSVSPYGTNFVKEFEYAAQKVVKEGVGSYAVCLTDYGWHIVYCSFSYKTGYMGENNKVYGEYDHNSKDVEGTFSNLFFEYVKESAYENYTTVKQNEILNKYDNEDCVDRYENRYKDLF